MTYQMTAAADPPARPRDPSKERPPAFHLIPVVVVSAMAFWTIWSGPPRRPQPPAAGAGPGRRR